MRLILSLLALGTLLGCADARIPLFPEPAEHQSEEMFLRGIEQLKNGAVSPLALQQLQHNHPQSAWAARAEPIIEISRERAALRQELHELRDELEKRRNECIAQESVLETCRQHRTRLEQENRRLEENLERLKILLIELEGRK